MNNPESNTPKPVEAISSLAVNSEGNVVLVTEGTDGSYVEESRFDIRRAQEIFLAQQKINSIFDEAQPREDETQAPGYVPVDLDEIQRQIEITREAGQA